MKVFLLACAALAVIQQYAVAEPVGKCPSTMNPNAVDFLVDSADCTIFYKCNWGKPVKYVCPDGLHFNKKLDVCDWPQAAGCTGSGGNGGGNGDGNSSESSDSNSSESGEHTPEPQPEPEPEPNSSSSSSSSSESGSNEDNGGGSGNGGGCDNGGGSGNGGRCSSSKCPTVNGAYPKFFAHPDTCERYCVCDWGKAFDMPCPSGLHFNTKLNVCDWPSDAGCK